MGIYPEKWTGHVGLVAWPSQFARPKSIGLFPVGTPKGVYLHIPSEDYGRCCSKASGICENSWCQCIKACPREFHVVHCHMT